MSNVHIFRAVLLRGIRNGFKISMQNHEGNDFDLISYLAGGVADAGRQGFGMAAEAVSSRRKLALATPIFASKH